MKALIGITPNGVVCFTSEFYRGSTSDPGYLQHIQRGDCLMADKGFTIIFRDGLVAVRGCLVLPHFLSGERQFSQEEAEHCQSQDSCGATYGKTKTLAHL